MTFGQFSAGSFAPLSRTLFKEIMETLTLYSSNSAEQHLLLDTGAAKYICSKHWLTQAAWVPLQMINIPAHNILLRLAGHAVCTRYGLKLAVSIFDINGNRHILKVFVYILPWNARNIPAIFILPPSPLFLH